MSWQDYVDKQLLASRCVTKAAIAGHDGNVWAKSEGFDVSNWNRRKKKCIGQRPRASVGPARWRIDRHRRNKPNHIHNSIKLTMNMYLLTINHFGWGLKSLREYDWSKKFWIYKFLLGCGPNVLFFFSVNAVGIFLSPLHSCLLIH